VAVPISLSVSPYSHRRRKTTLTCQRHFSKGWGSRCDNKPQVDLEPERPKMRSNLPVFMLKEISSTTSEAVAYHHAGDKSLPPCEANGNETRAIGPLTGIERILYQKKSDILPLQAWSGDLHPTNSNSTRSYGGNVSAMETYGIVVASSLPCPSSRV